VTQAAQDQLGQLYEEGDEVPQNWDLAYKLYYTSAMQGWKLGQLSRSTRIACGLEGTTAFEAALRLARVS
jgi:TPR repeat protein